MKKPNVAEIARDSHSSIRCLVALVRALIEYGLPAHRVEESVTRLGRAFGLKTSVLGLPTTLALTVMYEGKTENLVIRAEPGAMDFARLDELHRIIGRVERGELDADSAMDAMKAALDGDSGAGRAMRTLAGGLVSAGAIPLFGAGGLDVPLAFVLGALVVLFADGLAERRFGPVIATVSAFVVTLITSAVAAHHRELHPLLVTISALLVLLPGFALTTATVELATGHWVTGTARAVGSSLVFLEIGFGAMLGARLGSLRALEPNPHLGATPMAIIVGACALSLGFAILGNAKKEDALAHFGICALAFGICRGLAPFGPEVASFGAAFATGIAANQFARVRDRPSNILLVPGAYMLVPGGAGMLGLSASLLRDLPTALTSTVRLATTAFALGLGFILATSLLPPRTEL